LLLRHRAGTRSSSSAIVSIIRAAFSRLRFWAVVDIFERSSLKFLAITASTITWEEYACKGKRERTETTLG
jgi:hypothetical protein